MTERFRRGGELGSRAARGAPDGRNPLVCPSCGLRNDPSARFCRNCGLPLGWAQDPVRGTTTRHADLPSERGAGVASIIGLLAAVAVLAVAAFLVLRGSSGSATPTRTASPRPSLAVASSSGFASGLPSLRPSQLPGASTPASELPSAAATQPPASLAATTDFTCDPAAIGDSSLSNWRVRHVSWKPSGTYDTVIMDLTREGTATQAAMISVQSLALNEVSARYGLNPPRKGDRAVVVTFEGRVNGFPVPTTGTGMPVIPNLAMAQGSDGLWHAVFGVVGTGCHRIGVAAWSTQAVNTAKLLIDVQQ